MIVIIKCVILPNFYSQLQQLSQVFLFFFLRVQLYMVKFPFACFHHSHPQIPLATQPFVIINPPSLYDYPYFVLTSSINPIIRGRGWERMSANCETVKTHLKYINDTNVCNSILTKWKPAGSRPWNR
jgi:hypothetical protein